MTAARLGEGCVKFWLPGWRFVLVASQALHYEGVGAASNGDGLSAIFSCLGKTIGVFAKANWPGARVKGYNWINS
ncbi:MULTISPECIES: hypothetical protein [unclassified Alcanivorax]|uniref:hypothetical protein n=1 Tax=unclassified Alcanivorax TaxID=2638842 RepID=UPI000AE7A388|nr:MULTISPECIES: hypothetical protein [unclassified Alcanivorax]